MNFFEVFVGYVCIHLGGRNVAVSKHALHAPQVSAVHEQVCGEAMPECVW